jgi:hypothetical protein
MFIVLSLLRTAFTWSAVATTDSMNRSMLTAEGEKTREVPLDRLVVRVARDVVDLVVGLLEHDSDPTYRTEAIRAPELPQNDELEIGIQRRIARAVFTASRPYRVGSRAKLPLPVHLVAETPDPML